MIIDKRKSLGKLKLKRLLSAVSIIGLIALIRFTDITETYNIIIGKNLLTVIIPSLYILYYIYQYMLDYNYIYFDDKGNSITCKYFTLRPFQRENRAIEIPKDSLGKFEVKKSFFGLKQSIILYQITKKGVAKYPEISISFLTKNEKEDIIKTLKKYSKKKQ